MRHGWLDDAGERALVEATSYVESVSAVELVVAVRRRARSWARVPIVAASTAAWATLAIMMYSAPTFPLWSFLVDPFVIGGAVAWAASVTPSTVRWLTSKATRRAAAIEAARATFVMRRVHETRGRTGVLVYCALAERIAVVIADSGASGAVAPSRLAAWEADIETAMARGASATAEVIATMAPVFAAVLPRRADDVNELGDVLEHDFDRSARV